MRSNDAASTQKIQLFLVLSRFQISFPSKTFFDSFVRNIQKTKLQSFEEMWLGFLKKKWPKNQRKVYEAQLVWIQHNHCKKELDFPFKNLNFYYSKIISACKAVPKLYGRADACKLYRPSMCERGGGISRFERCYSAYKDITIILGQ